MMFDTIAAAERDASLRRSTGMTWDEIAAAHNMTCGACRDGLLALEEVNVTMSLKPPDFDATPRYASIWRSQPVEYKAVTLDLKCADCGATITLPLHATEDSQP